MAKLIDREYPFCSERKEFRLVLRALKSGWIDGETASDLIDQAVTRVLSHDNLRESTSLLKAAMSVDKRQMRLYRAEVKAAITAARAEICKLRSELAAKSSKDQVKRK